MKIFKIAAKGGKTNLRIVLDMETGEYKLTVTGHSEGASCSDELDGPLAKLMAGEDPILDEGETSEAFEDRAKVLAPKVLAPKAQPKKTNVINPYDEETKQRTGEYRNG